MNARRLILASSSPYRRELLTRLGQPFEVVVPNADESPLAGEAPRDLVRRLARLKAETVARDHPHSLVIGSDQVAVHDGQMVGKPGTHARAVEQLRAASGKPVTLYTGLALIDADSGRTQTDVVPFHVVFRPLTEAMIEGYLRRDQPYNCAGSVRAESLGIVLLERFDGEDPNALIGLPLIRLVRMLEAEGVQLV